MLHPPPTRRLLLLTFSLALLTRLLAVTLRGEFHPPAIVGNEAGIIAQHLLDGHGFASPFTRTPDASPSVHLAPAYPFLLAAASKLLGLSPTGGPSAAAFYLMLSVNLLAGSLLPLVAMDISRRAALSPRVSLLTGLLLCFCPEAFRAAGNIWDEALLALGVACLLWLLVLPAKTLWVGLANGLLSLLNPSFAPAAIVAWGIRKNWRAALVAALLTVAVGLPWHIRNLSLTGQPIFIRGNFWLEIWTSIHPITFETINGVRTPHGTHPWNSGEPMVRDGRPLTELQYLAWCRDRSLAAISADPAAYARHIAAQIEAFWLGTNEALRWEKNLIPFWLAQGLPAILGLCGLLAARRRLDPRLRRMLLSILLIFPLPYYLTIGAARYRHPIDIIIYLGIALAADQFLAHLAARRRTA